MSRFVADYRGIGELLNSEAMVNEMRRRAEAGRLFAVSVAPYDPRSTDGTHYRDSFRAEAGKRGGYRKDRAYGRLSNYDAAALWVEVGTSDTPARHVLRRALTVMERA